MWYQMAMSCAAHTFWVPALVMSANACIMYGRGFIKSPFLAQSLALCYLSNVLIDDINNLFSQWLTVEGCAAIEWMPYASARLS